MLQITQLMTEKWGWNSSLPSPTHLCSKHHLPLRELGASRFATLCEEGVVWGGNARQSVARGSDEVRDSTAQPCMD